MNTHLKFRQPLFTETGKFSQFHYWGFDANGTFTAPCGNLNDFEKAAEHDQTTELCHSDLLEVDIYSNDIVKLHLFTQELGENLGVREGEMEYIGVLSFGEYGIVLTHGADPDDWFYLVYAPGMIHEESFTLLGNIHQNPELIPA